MVTALDGPASLQRNPWTRLAWIEQDGMAVLCAAGEEYTCDIDTAERLCASPVKIPGLSWKDAATRKLICRLINDGHLFLEGPESA